MSKSKLLAHPVVEVDAVDCSLKSENTKNVATAPDIDTLTLVVTGKETSQSQTVDTEVQANDEEEKAEGAENGIAADSSNAWKKEKERQKGLSSCL